MSEEHKSEKINPENVFALIFLPLISATTGFRSYCNISTS